MKSKISQYAIIDFRTEEKNIKELKENFYHILYNEDFTKFTIKSWKGSHQVAIIPRSPNIATI